jgi:Cof subfamily protein (haloacid dehalogenase superfamily)
MRSKPPLLLLLALGAALSACAGAPGVRFTAVYLDLDGTALGPDHRVRPATTRALARYRACGGRVGLATGRAPAQVRPHLAALAPDLPLVLYNGGVVTEPDATRPRQVSRLAPGVRDRAIEAGRGEGTGVELVALHDLGLVVFDRESPVVASFAKEDSLPAWRVDPTLAWTADDEPVKALFLVTPGRADEVATALRAAVGDDARVLVSSERTVEVIPWGVDKASAIRAVLADQGLDVRDAIAFGDGENDVEMVSELGLGVAMANGRDRTRAAADLVIGAHDTDAIALLLEAIAIHPACQEGP